MKMKRPREKDCAADQKTPKFNEFLQVMKEFKSLPTYGFTNLEFIATRIKEIFRGHSKLILGFNMIFLPKQYAIEDQDQNRVKANSNKAMYLHESDYHHNYRVFAEVRKEKFRNPDEYKKYLKCLYLYSKEIISRAELREMVRDLLKHGTVPQKYERQAPASKRRKCLSKCEVDNPSYQLLTERISASGRTKLGVAVLNDSWVSAETSLTGGDTCHRFKKNVYEKKLLKCEDDRCERDRQFELVKGTNERVEDFLQKIVEDTVNMESTRPEDHFKVLRRLSLTYKNKMAAVYSKNFRKSLDYGNSSGQKQDSTSSSSGDDASTCTCPNLLAEPTT